MQMSNTHSAIFNTHFAWKELGRIFGWMVG